MKETEAARAVLLEVLNALGAMRDDLVIIGGWVPDLLYPSNNHVGVDRCRLGKEGSWSNAGGNWQGGVGIAASQVSHVLFRRASVGWSSSFNCWGRRSTISTCNIRSMCDIRRRG